MRRGVSFIMVAYPGPEKSIAGIAVLIRSWGTSKAKKSA